MPPANQILGGLREIANTYRAVSILWHIYFGALVVVLATGIRPSRRVAGWLLGLPFLSVSVAGWLSSNPFNGVVFAVLGIALLLVAARLRRDSVQIAPRWCLVPGLLMFAFGWVYPHFLDTASYVPYLYSAPTGIIPCPTLYIVIGSALTLDGLGSRTLCTILGVTGLFYGVTGVAQLHVALDWGLIAGGAVILICAFTRKWNESMSKSVRGA